MFSVSVLALEEYSTLQQKYALESQCRFEAEKYAAEVSDFGSSKLFSIIGSQCMFRGPFHSCLHALHAYDAKVIHQIFLSAVVTQHFIELCDFLYYSAVL